MCDGKKVDLVSDVLSIFQPIASRKLTQEDGRQIAENLLGFFQTIIDWDEADQKTDKVVARKGSECRSDQPVHVKDISMHR